MAGQCTKAVSRRRTGLPKGYIAVPEIDVRAPGAAEVEAWVHSPVVGQLIQMCLGRRIVLTQARLQSRSTRIFFRLQ